MTQIGGRETPQQRQRRMQQQQQQQQRGPDPAMMARRQAMFDQQMRNAQQGGMNAADMARTANTFARNTAQAQGQQDPSMMARRQAMFDQQMRMAQQGGMGAADLARKANEFNRAGVERQAAQRMMSPEMFQKQQAQQQRMDQIGQRLDAQRRAPQQLPQADPNDPFAGMGFLSAIVTGPDGQTYGDMGQLLRSQYQKAQQGDAAAGQFLTERGFGHLAGGASPATIRDPGGSNLPPPPPLHQQLGVPSGGMTSREEAMRNRGFGSFDGSHLGSFGGGQQGGGGFMSDPRFNQPPSGPPMTPGGNFQNPGGFESIFGPLSGQRTEAIETGFQNQQMFDRFFPQQRDAVGPNPADQFAGVMPGAQQNLNNLFGQVGGAAPQNPFLQQAQGIQAPQFGGLPQQSLPQAPGLTGAPTNFTSNVGGPSQAQGPSLSPIGQQQQFDPSSVGGPNVQQVSAQQVQGGGGDFSGPQVNQPSFQQAIQAAQGLGGGVQNVGLPREQLQSGRDPLAQQAFQSALSGNQTLAQGSGIDTGALGDAQQNLTNTLLASARRAGLNDAGSRGFGGGGQNTVADTAVARAMAPVMAQLGAQGQRDLLEAQQFDVGQQAGALGRLGQLGGTAGGLGLQEQQGLNQLGVGQRGQDLQAALANQSAQSNAAQNLGAVSGLIGTLNQGQNQAFGLGTERGLGQGAQNLQAGMANQQAGLQAGLANQQAGLQEFGAQTDRMGTLGGLHNQFNQQQGALGLGQQQNQIGSFNAGTNRQGVQNQFGLGAGQLQLGTDQLNSANQNTFNQQLNDQFNTQMQGQLGQNQIGANFQTGLNQAMNDRFRTQLGGMADLGGVFNQGQGMQNQLQLGAANIAAGLMQGSAQAQQMHNQLQQAAASGDQNAMLTLQAMERQIQNQRWMQKHMLNNQPGGGGLGGLIGGAVGLGLGAFTGGVGTNFAGSLFGI